MSTFERGKAFEQKVAKMIRLKIDKNAKRNPGSHANWNRRSDVYSELPIHLEAKDHEIVKIKEWYRQAEGAAFGKTPVVAWQMDNEVMATLRLEDLLDLFVEIADQKLEIEDLRKPSKVTIDVAEGEDSMAVEVYTKDGRVDDWATRGRFTDGTLKKEVKLCKAGHVCTPGRDTCMTKGCVYSSTYVKPKAGKEKK
jgi:hypothetical protein